jgi:hypothetical protein
MGIRFWIKVTIYMWEPSLDTVMHRCDVFKFLRSAIWKITWWNHARWPISAELSLHGLPTQNALTDLKGSDLGIVPCMALLLAPAWRSAQVWWCIALFMQNKVGFCQMIKSRYFPHYPFLQQWTCSGPVVPGAASHCGYQTHETGLE